MGDKITAKETVSKLGIPVVPGSDGKIEDLNHARKIADEIGYHTNQGLIRRWR